MTRETLPFVAPDLSAFARALGGALKDRHRSRPEPPGHVETLNLVARALGHRNVQSLRAALRTGPPLAAQKFTVQRMAMWVLWTHFDARRIYSEREVNAILRPLNAFGDHVTLRRELINHQLLARKSDCSEYRKLPARPDDETRALLQAWRAQQRAAPRQRKPAAAAASTLAAAAAKAVV